MNLQTPRMPKFGEVITSPDGQTFGTVIGTQIEERGEGKVPTMTIVLAGSGTQVKAQVGGGITGVVFGVPGHKKPYRGNLVGNIRIKYRMDDYAKIYVRDPYRIREYLLIDKGDYVTNGDETAQNQRTTPRNQT